MRVIPFAALATATALIACAPEQQQDEEQLPRQISSSTFHYPEELWEAGVEGETTLRILVSAEGTVDSVRVEDGSGHEQFDSAAVDGAQELRFEPGRVGEEPVPMWVILPVRFDRPEAESVGQEQGAEAGLDEGAP